MVVLTAVILIVPIAGALWIKLQLERPAISRLNRLGAMVFYPAGLRNTPRWLIPIEKAIGEFAAFDRVSYVLLKGDHITDADLAELASLSAEIDKLGIESSAITDAGLVHLKPLKNLQVLNIGSDNITDAGLMHLNPLKKLEYLTLRSSQITGQGLAHVADLPLLNILDLGTPNLEDAGLQNLRGVDLSHLDISGAGVSDAGLTPLESMKGLERLNVAGTRVTSVGMDALIERFPNIEIRVLKWQPNARPGSGLYTPETHRRGAPD